MNEWGRKCEISKYIFFMFWKNFYLFICSTRNHASSAPVLNVHWNVSCTYYVRSPVTPKIAVLNIYCNIRYTYYVRYAWLLSVAGVMVILEEKEFHSVKRCQFENIRIRMHLHLPIHVSRQNCRGKSSSERELWTKAENIYSEIYTITITYHLCASELYASLEFRNVPSWGIGK